MEDALSEAKIQAVVAAYREGLRKMGVSRRRAKELAERYEVGIRHPRKTSSLFEWLSREAS